MSKLKLNRDARFKQGIFIPVNRSKLIDSSNPVYRSGLELLFMRFCDSNPNIIKWGSESVVIPYYHPIEKKMRRYFVDNYVLIREGDKLVKYLVEIKPSSQCVAPVPSKRKKQSTVLYEQAQFVTNTAKWTACKEYCSKRDIKFLILTEKELK